MFIACCYVVPKWGKYGGSVQSGDNNVGVRAPREQQLQHLQSVGDLLTARHVKDGANQRRATIYISACTKIKYAFYQLNVIQFNFGLIMN